MRVIGALLFLGMVAGAVWWVWFREVDVGTLLGTAPRATPAPVPPVKTATQVHDCRDLCEQTALVEHWVDETLRACRMKCEGAVRRPYEPIRRITVAPADHHVEVPPR